MGAVSFLSSLWSVRRNSQQETLFIQKLNIFLTSRSTRATHQDCTQDQIKCPSPPPPPPLCTMVPSMPLCDEGAPSAVSLRLASQRGGCQSSCEPHLDESHLRRNTSLPAVRHHVITCSEDSDSDQLCLQADMLTQTNTESIHHPVAKETVTPNQAAHASYIKKES